MSTPRVALALALCAGMAPSSEVAAQVPPPTQSRDDEPRNCELIENEFVYIRVLADGTSNSYVSGPLEARCDEGVRIQADSAVIFEASGYSQLFDNVMFEDLLKQLTADRATYFGRDRRLIALGNGRIVDKLHNSVITGDTVVYARANDFRPEDLLNVRGGSPHATLFPPDRTPEPTPDTTATSDDAAADSAGSPATDSEESAAADSVVSTDEAASAPARPGGRAGRGAPNDRPVTPANAPEPEAIEAPDSVAAAPPEPAVNEAPDSVTAPTAAAPDSTPDSTTSAVADSVAASEEALSDSAASPAARADSIGSPAVSRPPSRTAPRYEVDALTFSITADRYFRAAGDVVIEKDSLEAYGDSLLYDLLVGDIILMGSARIDEDAFELTGDSILFGDNSGASQEIRAMGNASLVGQDVDLTAPQIRIELQDGLLERLIALVAPADTAASTTAVAAQPSADSTEAGATPRPRAIAQDFVLEGDSIEVTAPGEVLEQVTAMGKARGESVARDSLNAEDTPEVAQRDWLEGNEVTVFFSPDLDPNGEPVLTADGSGRARVRLDRVVAKGSARSLYRMTPSDTTVDAEPGKLALHYVTGSEITIRLTAGEVESMEVTGQARGYHLEPLVEPTPPPSESTDTLLPIDSMDIDEGLGPDTTQVDTTGTPTAQTDPNAPPSVSSSAVPDRNARARPAWFIPWREDDLAHTRWIDRP